MKSKIMANQITRTRQKQTPPTSYGYIPPQATELEEFILGAILLQRDAFERASDIIKPEMFYKQSNQTIYLAMQSLHHTSQPIDIGMVCEELKKMDQLETVGGPYAITKLTNSVVSSENIVSHCKIVFQKYVQRRLIEISGSILHEAYQDVTDPFELIEEAERQLAEVTATFQFGDMVAIEDVLVSAFHEIQKYKESDSSITGVPSGFVKLDSATRGWQNGDLIILAARPSVGKTAFALNIIRSAANYFKRKHTEDPKQNKHVAIFSLEMKSIMLVLRMLATESGEYLHNIQTGRLDEQQMENLYRRGAQPLSKMKIKFDDRPGLTMNKLKSKCRKMKRKGELGLIVIDYMQLITPNSENKNREQQVSEISRTLKLIAQELDVPIIALSQMSRDVEKRADRKPQLSDLRESGSIEQDADVVMFLWQPYTDDEILLNGSLADRRKVRIAKQRNGFLLTMELDFQNEIQLFTDIDQQKLNPSTWKQITIDHTEPSKATDEDLPDELPF